MERLIKKSENINEYSNKDIFIEDEIKNMSSMEQLNELSEADVKHDRCPICKYQQLKRSDGFKVCPRCNNIYKLLHGKAYIIY